MSRKSRIFKAVGVFGANRRLRVQEKLQNTLHNMATGLTSKITIPLFGGAIIGFVAGFEMYKASMERVIPRDLANEHAVADYRLQLQRHWDHTQRVRARSELPPLESVTANDRLEAKLLARLSRLPADPLAEPEEKSRFFDLVSLDDYVGDQPVNPRVVDDFIKQYRQKNL